LIGINILCYNGKLSKNIALRNKICDLLITKWHECDINKINPPYNQSFSDYLEECHVKLPQKKVNIEPESKKILK
jgi:hypothetical protein